MVLEKPTWPSQVLADAIYWDTGDPVMTGMLDLQDYDGSAVAVAEIYVGSFVDAANKYQPRHPLTSFYERKLVPFLEKTMPFPGLVIVFAIVVGWLLIRLLQIPAAS